MASILASCCAAASTSAIRSTTARAAGPLWQVAARRHFSSSTSTDAQQQTAPTSSSSPPPSPAASLDQLIVGDAPVFSSSALAPRRPSFTAPSSASRPRETRSSPTSLFLSQRDRQGGNEHPYRLHVHASKHNTILSLCRDLPPPPIDMEARYNAPRAVLDRANEGSGFGNPDADPEMYDKSTNKTYGQTVARTSCGQLGFRKAQRSTFEAATKTALRMFDMIDGLEEGRDRKRKDGSRVTDPKVTGIELIFKGYGQGRDAIVAALQTDRGKRIGALVKRVTDATPIKVGGTRPRKRRMLSPPLDLSRKRRP